MSNDLGINNNNDSLLQNPGNDLIKIEMSEKEKYLYQTFFDTMYALASQGAVEPYSAAVKLFLSRDDDSELNELFNSLINPANIQGLEYTDDVYRKISAEMEKLGKSNHDEPYILRVAINYMAFWYLFLKDKDDNGDETFWDVMKNIFSALSQVSNDNAYELWNTVLNLKLFNKLEKVHKSATGSTAQLPAPNLVTVEGKYEEKKVKKEKKDKKDKKKKKKY